MHTVGSCCENMLKDDPESFEPHCHEGMLRNSLRFLLTSLTIEKIGKYTVANFFVVGNNLFLVCWGWGTILFEQIC